MRTGNTHGFFFSPLGVIHITGSIILLGFGLYRQELAATICGTAILFYCIFSILITTFSFYLWRKAQLTIDFDAGKSISASIITPLPGFVFYISHATLQIRFRSTKSSSKPGLLHLTVPIAGQRATADLPGQPRGLYSQGTACLEISDFSRFFSITIERPSNELPESLIIPPENSPVENFVFPQSKIGQTRGKSTTRRSEELYEIRTYIPGDDPRKINWKVFAHTGELTIRQGELLPPPAQEYLFFINPFCPFSPDQKTQSRFNILVSRVCTLTHQLLNNNRPVSFLILNEKNQLALKRITPSDTAPHQAIDWCLSLPQPVKSESGFSELQTLIPEKTTLLVFLLPEQIPEPSADLKKFGNTTFYFGPVLPAKKTATLVEFIQKKNIYNNKKQYFF